MKKRVSTVITGICIFAVTTLAGCFKDFVQRTYTYTYYKPVYKTTAEVRLNIKSNAPQPIERPGKIFLLGNYIFLNEIDKGVHVINNSDPSHPVISAFIDIPGNMDIAVKDNILYADLYTDVAAIDISNPQNAVLKKIVEGVFPHRYYNSGFLADSTKVIATWEKRDTTITEDVNVQRWLQEDRTFFMAYAASGSSGGSTASIAPYGIGGSMARFTLANNRLYTVSNTDLDVFNVSVAADPQAVTTKNIGWSIETIFPLMNQLFIGSQSGMYVYDISNPDNPVQSGQFSHVTSCDPVIADQNFAYVTLRSGTACQGFTNELDILKLNNSNDPSLVKVYQFSNPHGLAKDGSTLFICDGNAGVKIFDASDVMNLKAIKQINDVQAYDVIAFNGRALVVAADGLYQYSYADLSNVRLLSKIAVSKQ
jgi:hypothetical protein